MEKPTSDEKVLAALAHASVLFAFFGPVGPTLIWASQRNKSKYVRFHALQAMGYQALTFWAWFIGIFFAVFGGDARSKPLSLFVGAPAVTTAIIGGGTNIASPPTTIAIIGGGTNIATPPTTMRIGNPPP